MEPLARLLILAGVALLLVGLLVWVLPSIPFLGRLPGDLRIERPGFRFYFPLTTCLLVSVLLTLLWWLLSRLK